MKFQFLFLIALLLVKLTAQSPDSIAIKQIDSLIKLSRSFTAKNDFDKALEVNAAAEKIALEKTGRLSAEYGGCCFNYGRVFKLKGQYPEAEKWYLEAKNIQEKALGKENAYYANTLNNLAVLYLEMGQYEKAEPLYLESKTIREKALGKEHPDYAQSLNNLAILYHNIGNYEKAEPLYLESKNLREKIFGKEHLVYAQSLNNLGKLYSDMSQYEKVEPLLLESKAIKEKSLGKEHPEYAQSLSSLGGLYYVIGQYEKAEPLYLESIAILKKVLGKEHPDYAYSLSNLALLYKDMGNYEKAEPLYLESKAIQEKAIGKENRSYAWILYNLAILYEELRQYEKAEPFYLESKAIREKALGKEHPDYAQSLNSLAVLYCKMDQGEKAEPLFLEANAIQEKSLGKEHSEYGRSLNNLANLYWNMGQFEKAKSLHLESKAIREKLLGKEHPEYLQNLRNLAVLFESQNRFSESEPYLEELYALEQARLSKAISFLSERELASYMVMFKKTGDDLGSYLLARLRYRSNRAEIGHSGILSVFAFDHTLFYKGYLLTAATQLNGLAEASSETKEINQQLKTYRRRLAAEYAKPIADRKNVAELEENANTAEKEMARSIVGYAESKRQVKWEELMATLKKDEAAIEFISFKVNFPKMTDSIMYAALLLKPGIKQPEFIPLFEEKSLDSLLHSKSEIKEDNVNALYSLVTRGATPIETSKKPLYESLYEMIWKPLEKELKGAKTIYFSPSGMLHQINQDAIPISKRARLVDKYKLIELNSTRQLVIPTQVKIANNDAVLYGGILYEQDSSSINSEHLLAYESRGRLSFTQTGSTIRGGTWNYLAGTESEVNSIEKIMQTSGFQTKLKKGYAATEESFKNIGVNNTPSPRVLHIATHGYFFADPKVKVGSSQWASRESGGSQESVFKMSDHPMLRSGLILAGGNAAWQGKQTLEGREDGILTAYEISQMNLSNTELVVLSACETGLGDIQGNEGVYGLQRAFKIAGAKYLIMSLWQVPDKQTSLLMTTFYKKWLQKKMSIPDAFHAAQKELRDNGLDPYNWAGFVLVE